jgi:hypothetical protein
VPAEEARERFGPPAARLDLRDPQGLGFTDGLTYELYDVRAAG